MPSQYPSVIVSLTDPQPSDQLNNPAHSSLHQSENAEIEQIQTFVGTINTSAIGTILYDIRSPDSDGGGHIQSVDKGGTGQTSYSKGDLLVAISPLVLSKFAVGTDGSYLVADSTKAAGINWGFGGAPTVRVYNSSVVQIWNRPSTLTYAIIEVQAGGGPGAPGSAGSNGGGGGAGGGYSKKIIGAGSLPIAASVFAGGSSMMSYFGSVLSATPGGSASGAAVNAGGIGIGGDLNLQGQSGIPGQTNGSGSLGGTGGTGIIGGDGGSGGNSSGSAPGAPGMSGNVVIYEY